MTVRGAATATAAAAFVEKRKPVFKGRGMC